MSDTHTVQHHRNPGIADDVGFEIKGQELQFVEFERRLAGRVIATIPPWGEPNRGEGSPLGRRSATGCSATGDRPSAQPSGLSEAGGHRQLIGEKRGYINDYGFWLVADPECSGPCVDW